MKQLRVILGVIVLLAWVNLMFIVESAAQGYHRHFHIHQTSLTSFVVTCDNGADPTVKGGVSGENRLYKLAVEITCGK